jgi:4-hydroxybenzoate polyprenyltransferase
VNFNPQSEIRSPQIIALVRDIKLEHSLFALPFAFIGAVAAARSGAGELTLRTGALVLLCMIFARTAAMGFNRWMDAEIDRANPRTSGRAIPSGRLSPGVVLATVIVASGLFISTAALINPLCGYLSPLALVVILGYSTTKRWTALSHLVLGLSLAMSPAGGWLAVAGAFALPLWILAAAVIFWVAGFDVLYSLQDVDFDRGRGLHSIPARLGERAAYGLSRLFHLLAAVALFTFGNLTALGAGWFAASAATTLCLVAQQLLARDRNRIPVAFFHLNASIGFILLAGLLFDYSS